MNPNIREALEGRVAIITGSSRGIGREFALRLARAGVHIVVTGKSETEQEHLPGTVHTVAAEVRALGVRALPLRVNVRDEQDIASMVSRTMDEFGRIDILINNAGALWWEDVVNTPPNRVSLMFDVNLRASYLTTYYALPHLQANGWGHIIMNSPPITTVATPGKAMYNAMKMGMTRLAIGVAAENLADNIAANSLWPAAPIESLATITWSEDKMGRRDQWRTPEIMCDALMEVVTSPPRSCTGQQLVDEALLRSRGWSEERLDGHWVTGRRPVDPLWIDNRVEEAARD